MIFNILHLLLNKYRNEFIITLFFLFMIFSIIVNIGVNSTINTTILNNKQIASDIIKTSLLQKYWNNKKFKIEAKKLKTIVPLNKIKTQRISSKKLILIYQNLIYRDVNKILNRLINKPFQIIKLVINHKKKKNIFTMELECKW